VVDVSDPSRPEVVDVHEGPEPGTVIRMAAPWVVLVILLLVLMNIFGQYQAQTKAERTAAATDSVRVDPGPAAPSKTASSTAGAKTAAPKGPVVAVIMDGVNFRESANNGSAVIEALKQGATLTWIATQGNWYKARDAKGRTGYISSNPTLTQKR
jgi:uncharacterized protein YgiM (DUF1202 family)